MPDEYILDIVTDRGIPFRVVYGIREDIHGRPMTEYGKVVAFYDRRFLHTRHGQFVSDYDADTLLNRPIYGLNLRGNVENWSIDRINMIVVDEWLDALVNMSR